jgi:hypothetical protein
MPRVTDGVMQRVADAIGIISNDPETALTKREIERVSGLSHDAVARAFRQDRTDPSAFVLNARFEETVEKRRGRRTEANQLAHDAREDLRAARIRISQLEVEVASYAQVILAQQIEIQELRDPEGRVTPIAQASHSRRKGRRD